MKFVRIVIKNSCNIYLYKIDCLTINEGIQIALKKYIKEECSDINEWTEFNEIRAIEITPTNSFNRVQSCRYKNIVKWIRNKITRIDIRS